MVFSKNVLARTWNIFKQSKNDFLPSLTTSQCRNLSTDSEELKLKLREVEDVVIPTPWGHIAGVWWGPRDKQPVVALHGWQDNANTWNKLIPLLPDDIAILAIDFPGHGKSTKYPPGMFYYFPDNIVNIRRVVQHFGWKDVSLIGHSMGGIGAFMYAACYPTEVNYIIQLDILKPITARKGNTIEKLAKTIDSLLFIDKRNVCSLEPPSYTPEELVEKLYLGSSKSILKEYCKVLLERGSARSARDSSKYFYTRDYRIVLSPHLGFADEDVRAMAVRLTCPMLVIKFENATYFEPKEKFYEILDLIKSFNKDLEFHTLPGTHHGHFQSAHLVAPLINSFLEKHHK